VVSSDPANPSTFVRPSGAATPASPTGPGQPETISYTAAQDGCVGVVLINRAASGTYTSAKGRHETSVDNPSRDDGGDRGRVVDFAAAATRAGAAAGDFEPSRVALVIVAGSDATTDVRPWPLSRPATGMPGYPQRPCLIMDGGSVPDSLRTATTETRWTTDDGHPVALRVRPLLPYEHTCADIGQG
jgi:hypothetical protein